MACKGYQIEDFCFFCIGHVSYAQTKGAYCLRSLPLPYACPMKGVSYAQTKGAYKDQLAQPSLARETWFYVYKPKKGRETTRSMRRRENGLLKPVQGKQKSLQDLVALTSRVLKA